MKECERLRTIKHFKLLASCFVNVCFYTSYNWRREEQVKSIQVKSEIEKGSGTLTLSDSLVVVGNRSRFSGHLDDVGSVLYLHQAVRAVHHY